MNKIKLIIYAVIATVIFASCGPSATEKRVQYLADSARVADSTAAAKNDTLKVLPSADVIYQEKRMRDKIDNAWATVFCQVGGKFERTSMFAAFRTEAKEGGVLEVDITDEMKPNYYLFSNNACNLDSNEARYPVIGIVCKDDSPVVMSEKNINEALSFLFPDDMKLYTRTQVKDCECESDPQVNADSVNILITQIAYLCTKNDIADRSFPEYGLIDFKFSKQGTFYCTYQASNITSHLYIERCLWSGKKPYIKIAFTGDRKERTYRNMNSEEQKIALKTLFNFLKKKTEKGKES